jgi:hypothetical protein
MQKANTMQGLDQGLPLSFVYSRFISISLTNITRPGEIVQALNAISLLTRYMTRLYDTFSGSSGQRPPLCSDTWRGNACNHDPRLWPGTAGGTSDPTELREPNGCD